MNTEPRSETIARHVREALMLDGTLTERSYAERVMVAYHQATPLHLRRVHFELGSTVDAVERAQRANAAAVRRFVSGEVRMPVDLEEALVDALPPAVRERCIRALSARRGMLPVAMPTADGIEQTRRVAELMHSAADAVAAIAPMLSDGTLDAADRPYAAAALDQLRRVIADATCLHAQIHAVLAPATVHPIRRVS